MAPESYLRFDRNPFWLMKMVKKLIEWEKKKVLSRLSFSICFYKSIFEGRMCQSFETGKVKKQAQ